MQKIYFPLKDEVFTIRPFSVQARIRKNYCQGSMRAARRVVEKVVPLLDSGNCGLMWEIEIL